MSIIMNAIYFAGFFSLLLLGVIITNIMILYRFPLVEKEQDVQVTVKKSPLEDMNHFMGSDSITKDLTRPKRRFRNNI